MLQPPRYCFLMLKPPIVEILMNTKKKQKMWLVQQRDTLELQYLSQSRFSSVGSWMIAFDKAANYLIGRGYGARLSGCPDRDAFGV